MAEAPCKNTKPPKTRAISGQESSFWRVLFARATAFCRFLRILSLKKLEFAWVFRIFFLWLPGANHFLLSPHVDASLQQCYQNHHHEILWISLVFHGLSSGYQFGLLPSDGFMQKVRKGSVITEQLLEIYATPSIAISLCSHCLLSGLWFSWVTLVCHISTSSPPQVPSCL